MPGTPDAPAAPVLARAARFVWQSARVLEQRLFAHHFLDGSPDPVETALTAYRNPDGGYGHGLDPDLHGPLSEPAHTCAALRLLDAVGRCTGQRVQRVCRYLTEAATPDGALPAVRPDRRDRPSAPWPVPSHNPAAPPPSCGDLLITGPVVGVLHRNDIWHAWLFRATDFCWAAVEALQHPEPAEVLAALAFLEGARERPRAEAAAERLGRLVRMQGLVRLDGPGAGAHGPDGPAPNVPDARPAPQDGAPDGPYAPTDYAPAPHSLARRWFSEPELERSLDLLAAQQLPDGGWPATRRGWAPGTLREHRPAATITALATLRAYGRIGDLAPAATDPAGPADTPSVRR